MNAWEGRGDDQWAARAAIPLAVSAGLLRAIEADRAQLRFA